MRIIDNIRPDRQTVMFSATFPRPMEALARRILKKPIEVQVGGRSVVCKDVEQHVAVLEEEAKFFKLLELLGHHQVSFAFEISQNSTVDRLHVKCKLKSLNCRNAVALLCSWTNKKMQIFYWKIWWRHRTHAWACTVASVSSNQWKHRLESDK